MNTKTCQINYSTNFVLLPCAVVGFLINI